MVKLRTSQVILGLSAAFFITALTLRVNRGNGTPATGELTELSDTPASAPSPSSAPAKPGNDKVLEGTAHTQLATRLKLSNSAGFNALAWPAKVNEGCCHLNLDGSTREKKTGESCELFCPITDRGNAGIRVIVPPLIEDQISGSIHKLFGLVMEVGHALGYTGSHRVSISKIYINHNSKTFSTDSPGIRVPDDMINIISNPRNKMVQWFMARRRSAEQTFDDWCDPLKGYATRGGCASAYVDRSAATESAIINSQRSYGAGGGIFTVKLDTIIQQPSKVLASYLSFLGFVIPPEKQVAVKAIVDAAEFSFASDAQAQLFDPSLWSHSIGKERLDHMNIWNCDKNHVYCTYAGLKC